MRTEPRGSNAPSNGPRVRRDLSSKLVGRLSPLRNPRFTQRFGLSPSSCEGCCSSIPANHCVCASLLWPSDRAFDGCKRRDGRASTRLRLRHCMACTSVSGRRPCRGATRVVCRAGGQLGEAEAWRSSRRSHGDAHRRSRRPGRRRSHWPSLRQTPPPRDGRPAGAATAEPTPYAAAARTERHERTAEARDGRA